MDALRKAEADKKAAAARTPGAPTASEDVTSGFATTAEQLRLEPLVEQLSPSAGPARRSDALPGSGNISQRLSASGRLQPLADLTIADEMAFVHPPLSPEVHAGGSLSRPELVTARTVFAATQRRRLQPLALGLSAALLVTCGSLGWLGYHAFLQTPPPLVMPSPRVALGVEHGIAIGPVAAIPTPALPVVVLPPPAPEAEVAEKADVAPSVPADMATVAAALEPAPSALPPRDVAATAPPQDFEMRNGDLHIAHSAHGVGPAQRELTLAYHAFENGDLVRAKRAYLAVLKTHPQQRDALLGLGAIALAENRLREAHRYYAEVLRDTPDHPIATAAIFLIEGGRGAHATEAKLKLLLDRGFEAPYLHFALGNWYAREQRWGDAQQAYFAAFRGQPRNADYVFNLAVSLDQLGQRKAALDYYRQAVALRSATTNFDGAVVAARIAALAAP